MVRVSKLPSRTGLQGLNAAYTPKVMGKEVRTCRHWIQRTKQLSQEREQVNYRDAVKGKPVTSGHQPLVTGRGVIWSIKKASPEEVTTRHEKN